MSSSTDEFEVPLPPIEGSQSRGRCKLCRQEHTTGFPWMFSCFLKGRRALLTDQLNVAGEFYVKLNEEGILSKREYARLKALAEAGKDQYHQTEVLLQMLDQRDDKYYLPFLRVLDNTKHSQTASMLKQYFIGSYGLDDERRKIDLKVNGIRNTEAEFYEQTFATAYPMTVDPRGTALVINVFNVKNEVPRHGSQVDVETLDALFTKLHFKVKKCTEGNNAEAIKSNIKGTLSGEVKAIDQCFVLFVMSHGGLVNGEEVLYGSDGRAVTKKEILNIVSDDETYPQLKDKPRLVFFVSCRGDKEIAKDNIEACHPHVLVAHSSSKDHVSYRYETYGTLFVSAFGKVVVEKAHDSDIVTIMNKVIEEARQFDPKYEQIPQFYWGSAMKEHMLYFYPGNIISDDRPSAAMRTGKLKIDAKQAITSISPFGI